MRLRMGLLAASLPVLMAGNGCMLSGPHTDEDRVAGGGGLETVGIRGKAKYPDGRAVVGASVKLLPREFLADTSGGPLRRNGLLAVAETQTNGRGDYAFDSVVTGEYVIEVHDQDAHGAVLDAQIGRAEGPMQKLEPATLTAVGSLTGRVSLGQVPVANAYVRIFGMDRVARSDANGRFVFPDIPEGVFGVSVSHLRPYGYVASVTLGGVLIEAGVNRDLGSVDIPEPCPEYACDSLVVAYILDKAGRVSTPVESVTFLAPGRKRISELDLSAMGITGLPKEIMDMQELYRLELDRNNLTILPLEVTRIPSLEYLSLNYNKLKTVPPELANLKRLTWLYLYGNAIDSLPAGIGGLSALRYLVLDYNNLRTLPPEAGNLTGLSQLFLSNNRISSLPESIAGLAKVSVVGFQGNRLCAPSAAIQAWLDKRASPWRSSQICP